jgi:Domain of unknown function (DUF3127)
MTLEVTGKLHVKYEPQEFGEKKFKTREFVLELAEEISGNTYTNFAKMQLVQAKCDIIDRFNIGDLVKVSFNIRGRSYVDKKDGSTKYISNLDAWRVEAASATPSTNQQAPAYNQQAPAYNNNAGGNTGGNNFNQAPNYNPSPETIDDLPF